MMKIIIKKFDPDKHVKALKASLQDLDRYRIVCSGGNIVLLAMACDLVVGHMAIIQGVRGCLIIDWEIPPQYYLSIFTEFIAAAKAVSSKSQEWVDIIVGELDSAHLKFLKAHGFKAVALYDHQAETENEKSSSEAVILRHSLNKKNQEWQGRLFDWSDVSDLSCGDVAY